MRSTSRSSATPTALSTYFEVLEAQQQLFPAQIELARTMRDQLTVVVLLYRALGGGWNLEVEEWTPDGRLAGAESDAPIQDETSRACTATPAVPAHGLCGAVKGVTP